MTTLVMSITRRIRVAGRRLRALTRRDTLDHELDRELAFHVEQLTAELVAGGMPPDEARHAARRQIGNLPLLAEQCRDVRRVGWLLDFRQDVAFAMRMLLRHPIATFVIVSSLAIGIGANTAVIAVMDTIARTRLAIPDPERVVVARTFSQATPGQSQGVTAAEFVAWQDETRSLEPMGVSLGNQSDFGESHGAPAERIQGVTATSDLFSVLRVPPLLGRVFVPGDVRAGEALPLVISHRLWVRRFGAERSVIGATIRMNRQAAQIIGVMPEAFHYPAEAVDYWVPFVANRSPVQSPQRLFNVTARLKPGFTREQAEADLNRINAHLARENPSAHAGWSVQLSPVRTAMFGWTAEPLWTLEAAFALVLLVACTNVAVLLLARALTRRAEMGVRTALGAGRGRLVRQLLAETSVLSLAGGLLGVGLAWLGVRALLMVPPPPGSVAVMDVTFNGRMVALAAAMAIGAGLLFGVVPALAGSQWNVAESKQRRWREALVGVQIAVTFVLLVGAGLLARSFLHVVTRDVQFDPERMLSVQLNVPLGDFMQPRGALGTLPYFEISPSPALLFQRIHEELQALPGALAVAGTSLPLVNSLVTPTIEVAPGPSRSGVLPATGNADALPLATAYFMVTPGFVSSIGAHLVHGRDFERRDSPTAQWVAVVNETAAARMWPGEEAVGRQFTIPGRPQERPREVIGVVRDIPLTLPWAEPQPVVYLSYLQQPSFYPLPGANLLGQMTFMVRTTGDPMDLLPAVRQVVASIDADRPLSSVQTVEQSLRSRMPRRAQYVTVIGGFALAATLLAAIGVYGIVAYNAARRTREIGIRLALGASTRDVVNLVGRRAVLLAAVGLVAGLAGALAFTQLLRSQLWGVTPTDPITFVAAAVLLLAVCGVASALPTRRAVSVSPTVALRTE
jgi:predicted permease